MKKMLFGCVTILTIFLCSCTKDPMKGMTEEESRIYITNHDTTVTFTAFKTFSIADSVAVISNNTLQGRQQTSYDVALIQAITNALVQRGYTKVSNTASPDLGVAVSRINNTSTGLVAYDLYGGYYSSYYDPFYWGYPGYSYYFPTYYGTYQVSENALSVDVFDLKNGRQNNQLKDVWSGLVRGEGIFRPENVSSQVQALFDQSPYLKTL